MNAKDISTKFRVLLASACVAVSAQSFAEDAYLESDGTQYVVTGYHPTEKMKLVADFQIVTETKSLSILGNKNNSGEGASFLVWMNGTPNLEGSFTSAENKDIWSGRLKSGIGANRYTVKVDYAAGSFVLLNPDGSYADPAQKEKKPTGARRTGVGDRPLSFFVSTPASANAGTTGAAMKLYSAQIYEDDVLIHDYVPCKKGERIGLYDKKTGEFWGSATRPLAIAGDYMTVEDDPYVASPKNNVDNTSGKRAIFDTGYRPNAKTRVELDYAFIGDFTKTTADWCLMMAHSPTGQNKDGIFSAYHNQGNFGLCLDMEMYKGVGTMGKLQDGYGKYIRRTVVLDAKNGRAELKTGGYLNGSYTMTGAWTEGKVYKTLKLCGFDGNTGGYAPVNVYGFKVYEDDVLIHDFVPAKCGDGGALKDKVTGLVLKSMNADSPFAVSGVTDEEPYVQSTGNQIVILDYKPNSNSVVHVDCSHLDQTGKRYICGVDDGAKSLYGWVNGSTDANGPGIEFKSHNAMSWRTCFVKNLKDARHQLIMDVPSSRVYVYTNGVNLVSYDASYLATHTGYTNLVEEASRPMALFGVNKSSVALTDGAAVRIYGANVYENKQLVHSYQPYVKDGEVGFKDFITGKFFGPSNDKSSTALTYSGDIGGESEAYIESDQTQYILTDFVPQATSRIELDFRLKDVKADYYIMGASVKPYWNLYVNGNLGFTELCHTDWDGYTKTTANGFASKHRFTMVMDGKKRTGSIYRSDGSEWIDYFKFAAALTQEQTVKLGLFARQNSNGTHYPSKDTTKTGGMVPMYVYSLRCYDNDVLIREYLPYKNGTVTGLKDTVSGKVFTSSEGNPFVVGGKGYDGGKTFAAPLADTRVLMDKTVTLSVFAPGAVRYEWTRAGVPLAATGDTATLGWERSGGEGAQEISVTPVYNVYGREVRGTPSTATLTNVVPGFSLFVR